MVYGGDTLRGFGGFEDLALNRSPRLDSQFPSKCAAFPCKGFGPKPQELALLGWWVYGLTIGGPKPKRNKGKGIVYLFW